MKVSAIVLLASALLSGLASAQTLPDSDPPGAPADSVGSPEAPVERSDTAGADVVADSAAAQDPGGPANPEARAFLPPTDSPPQIFPARVVALQLSRALADPRNEDLWRQLEANRPTEGPAAVARADAPVEIVESTAMVTMAEPRTESNTRPGDLEGRVAALWSLVRERAARSVTAIAGATALARAALGLDGGVDLVLLPWLIAGGLGAVLFLIGLMARRVRSRRTSSQPQPARSVRTARKLASRGLNTTDVARRTGLSKEVVQLIEVLESRASRGAVDESREVA